MSYEQGIEKAAKAYERFDNPDLVNDSTWAALQLNYPDYHKRMLQQMRAAVEAFLSAQTPAWEGVTNVDEVQDLIYECHSHVIDVSKMEPVWIVERETP